MRKILYLLYGLWVLVALVLKISVGVSWWVATSWAWLPACIAFVLLLVIFVSVDLGAYFKRKQDELIPDRCENCVFFKSKEYSASGKCLGEDMGETHKENEPCAYYRRHIK